MSQSAGACLFTMTDKDTLKSSTAIRLSNDEVHLFRNESNFSIVLNLEIRATIRSTILSFFDGKSLTSMCYYTSY